MAVTEMARVEEMLELQKEYYRFVAIFTWSPENDILARERLGTILNQYPPAEGPPPDADVIPGAAYSLTGARTLLVIGITKSAPALYLFCSSIIFNSGIQANFYHCVEYHEVKEIWTQLQH